MEYLSLPFVLREGYFRRASLQESITYSVGLMLSTRMGLMQFDPEFGCEIWGREFSDLYTTSRANIRANLRNTIDKFEKRLYNVSVSFTSPSASTAQALGVLVKVSGNYRDGDE